MSRQQSFGLSRVTLETLEDGVQQVEQQELDAEEQALLAELQDWSRISTCRLHKITSASFSFFSRS